MSWKKIRQITFFLITALLLNCCSSVALAAQAPAPDGIKEAAYTNEKMLRINTAFAGPNGASIENSDNISINAWYYWDERNIYVWVDIHDPNNAVLLDVVYLRTGTNENGNIFENGDVEYCYNTQTNYQ